MATTTAAERAMAGPEPQDERALTEPRAAARGADLHKQFLAQVIRLALTLGWDRELIYTTFDSRHSQGGFLDLHLAREATPDGRPARYLVRELKTGSARLSRKQAKWLRAQQAAGVDAGVWRPHQEAQIVRELRGESTTAG